MHEELFKIQARVSSALFDFADETKQSVIEGKLIWTKMINHACHNKPFAAKVTAWVEQPSTLVLRDLAKEVGYDYADLRVANAVDILDAASTRFIDGSSTA